MTEATGKLAAALAKAQAEIKGAKKDAENPFFKSTYADLASTWEACREALSKNELAVVQPTDLVDGAMILKTILMHSSGESITGILPIMVGDKATAQQVGSAITYARRYALAAMVGVAPEDDDGNSASETQAKTTVKKPVPTLVQRAKAFEAHLDKMQSEMAVNNLVASNNGLLAELHKMLPQDYEKLSQKINQINEAFKLAEGTQ
jgi:hypothetical protein